MPSVLCREEIRSMFAGYPMAMGGICILCYGLSRSITPAVPKSSEDVVIPTSSADSAQRTIEHVKSHAQSATPSSKNPPGLSDIPDRPYTPVEAVQVYALVAVYVFEFYLFFQFGRLTVKSASEDFTAKVLSIFWTILCASMPFACAVFYGEAIRSNERRSLKQAADEASKASEPEQPKSQASNGPSHDYVLIEQDVERPVMEDSGSPKSDAEEKYRRFVERHDKTLPISFGVLEGIEIVCGLTLCIPFFRTLFA